MRDQRTMCGGHLRTVEEIQAAWDRFLARRGQKRSNDNRKISPYLNHGRWVADCPQCNGGIACWDQNPEGCCLDCGHTYKMTWGDPKERTAIEKALETRPESFQNWMGESVEELERESALMQGL